MMELEPTSRGMRRTPLLLGLMFALGTLAGGCLLDGGGGPAGLPEGSYFIAGRFDADYAYSQYFVVFPDRRWEWDEYGYNAATETLCKATRKSGTYVLGDSVLTLTEDAASAAFERCGMTKGQFKAITMAPIKDPEPAAYDIRTLTDSSFQAWAFFGTKDDWKEYVRKKDPYGFHD